MNWEDVRRKLASRKFWAMIAVFVPALLVFVGVIDVDKAEQLKALIILGGGCIAYIFAESAVDIARIVKEARNDDDELGDKDDEEQ